MFKSIWIQNNSYKNNIKSHKINPTEQLANINKLIDDTWSDFRDIQLREPRENLFLHKEQLGSKRNSAAQ